MYSFLYSLLPAGYFLELLVDPTLSTIKDNVHLHTDLSLPQWFLMVLAGALTLVIILTFVLFIKYFIKFGIKNGIKIGFKNFYVLFSGGKDSVTKGSPSGSLYGEEDTTEKPVAMLATEKPVVHETIVHRSCPYAIDTILSLKELWEIFDKRATIKYFGTMRKQMNVFEEKLHKVMALLQDMYLKELKKRKLEERDLVGSTSYRSYKNVLYIIEIEFLQELRRILREDVLSTIDEREFSFYINNKIDYLVNLKVELFNELYYFHEDITRDELYSLNHLVVDKIESYLREGFHESRRISIDDAVTLKECDDAYKKIFSKYTKII